MCQKLYSNINNRHKILQYLGTWNSIASIIKSIKLFRGNFSNLEKCTLKICSGYKKELNRYCWAFILPCLPPPLRGNIHFRWFWQSGKCSFSNFQGEISRHKKDYEALVSLIAPKTLHVLNRKVYSFLGCLTFVKWHEIKVSSL